MTKRSILAASGLCIGWLAASAAAQQAASSRPVGPQNLASAPTGICANSIADQAGGPCLVGASIPTYGMLYPLSTDFFISSANGYVGMGTAYPAAKLHVVGEGGVLVVGNLQTTAPFSTIGAGPRMQFVTSRGAFRAGIASASGWETSTTGIASAAFGSATFAPGFASTAFGIDSRATGDWSLAGGQTTHASGMASVALGYNSTASGQYAFSIGDSVTASSLGSFAQGLDSTSSGAYAAALGVATLASSYAGLAVGRNNIGGGSALNWVPTDPVFEVGIGSLAVPANALTVLKNGRVGIGTPTPGVPLQVQGGSDASPTGGGYLQLGSPSSSNLILDDNEILARSNGAVATLSLNANGGNVNINAAGTGRVAIGLGSPAFTLDVNGTAGKPGGGSWSVSSDARLKKNVHDLDGALEQLLELRGVKFEYIDPAAIGELEGERIGFIAQEVERVFPDWVGEKDDGMKFLTVRGFEALSVEALRELEQRNEDLQAQVDALRAQVEVLLEHVARTEAGR